MSTEEQNSNFGMDADVKQQPVIEIEHLSKSFGENKVLRDFDMKLYSGENLAILGKSGSGKSVLIKCIIGLLKPEEGSIKVFGENVPTLKHAELDKLRIRIGFLFQSNALYDSMTVRENLEFPLRVRSIKVSEEETNHLVMEALTNVGLANTVDMRNAKTNWPCTYLNFKTRYYFI
jgi:phospholipid/cholesterol/gamma-HCH transport system ATP-binding protein